MTSDRWKPVPIEKNSWGEFFPLSKIKKKKGKKKEKRKKEKKKKTMCIIPSLFTINTTWRMTGENLLNNSSIFTSWTTFIY